MMTKHMHFSTERIIGELTVTLFSEDGFSVYVYQNSDTSFCRFYQVQAKELEPQTPERYSPLIFGLS